MADLHRPAPRLLRGVASLGIAFLPTSDHVWDAAVLLNNVQSLAAVIAGIGAQVIDVRCGHNERQGDTSRADQTFLMPRERDRGLAFVSTPPWRLAVINEIKQ